MKPVFKYSLILLLSSFIFTSCKEDPKEETPTSSSDTPKVQMTLTPKYENSNFAVGTVYYDSFGHRIRVDNFQSYISNITLHDDLGNDVVIKDVAMWNMGIANTFTAEIPAGSYSGLSIGIGVPEDKNKDIDPTTYPNDHPLSVYGAQGMFWTWNTGYIFTKFEGKADFTGTEGASLLSPFAFHVGDDPNYRTVNLDFPFTIEAKQTVTIPVVFQVDQILNGGPSQVDVEVDYITHTSDNPSLAERIIDNFAASFSIE